MDRALSGPRAERATRRSGTPVKMKTLLNVLVALSVLVTGLTGRAQNAPPAVSGPPARRLAESQEAVDQKEYARAVTLLKNYVQDAPDDPIGHFQVGHALAGLEQWDEAEV